MELMKLVFFKLLALQLQTSHRQLEFKRLFLLTSTMARYKMLNHLIVLPSLTERVPSV